MHTNRRTVDIEVLKSWEVAKQNQFNLVLGLVIVLICSISCLGIASQSQLSLGIYQDSLIFILGIITLAIILFSYSLWNPNSDINQQIDYARLRLYAQARIDNAQRTQHLTTHDIEMMRTRCYLEFDTLSNKEQAFVVSRLIHK
jgi:hypothetical protein